MMLLFAILSLLLPPQEAEIVFAGDAMQHQIQLDNARRADGTYDYSETFAEIAPWVTEADYAVVNLETTLGERNFTGYPCFCSPDSYAQALKDSGFDLFMTANNHTLDRRDKGLRRTVAVLDSMGVDHIGTYTDKGARTERLPLIKDINGFKVAFLNYTYGTNGIKIQGDVVVDYIDRALIRSDVQAARDAGAEIVVAMPHWGVEYVLKENATQRALVEYMLDLGVDAVVGGHPHVVQPMHIYQRTDSLDKRLVVYSMGNFVSGMRTTDTRGGAMVKLKLYRDKDMHARIAGAEYRLVYTIPGQKGRRSHRLVFLDPDTPDSKFGQLAPQARAFRSNALRALDAAPTAIPRHTPQPLAADSLQHQPQQSAKAQ